MIFSKLSDAHLTVDVQNALVKVTGSFSLGRMTQSVQMNCRQALTPVDITVKCQGHLTRLFLILLFSLGSSMVNLVWSRK